MVRCRQARDDRILLRSPHRAVTAQDVAAIQAVMAAHPAWGRTALALHVCRLWDWRRPDGTWNHRACRHLLGRLAAQGLLTLPPPQSTPGRRPVRSPVVATPVPPAAPGAGLTVRLVRLAERPRWRALLATHHYLGDAHPVGETRCYVATYGGQWVALLAWGAAALKCAARDAWIGWDAALKARRLHLVANNVRFLVLPDPPCPSLASQVLGRTVRRLSADWQARYGHPILLAETFVDPARFRGTCYRAAGWVAVGRTKGYGRHHAGYHAHGIPKQVFVRPLRPDAARQLAAPFPPPVEEGRAMLDVNRLPLEGAGGLLEVLRTLPDPRQRRGIRHSVCSILALATCACLTGARSFEAIAQWAAELAPDVLRRVGCRRPRPPSEPTFRRVLQRVDAAAVDRAVGAWVAAQGPLAGQAIAVDGKTVRGARDGAQKAPHLLSAVLHDTGLVLAQQAVGEKTNEIPCVPPLLAGLDLTGAVVTLDALHTQTETARHLVEDKHADYVLTAKDNQPTLKADIATLRLDAFPPGAHDRR